MVTAVELIAAIHLSLDELERAVAARDLSPQLTELDARVKRITATLGVPLSDVSIVSATGAIGVAKE